MHGLYVHVPLCRSKCRYCAFYSVPRPEQQGAWLDALAEEVKRHGDRARRFDTLYLGGGTPSQLEPKGIERLVGLLQQSFSIEPSAERTIELNPADVTADMAHCWRAAGFNRASVGVQSFDDAELRWLGRRHDAAQAARSLEVLRDGGFGQLSIDLVQGLPGQSMEQRLGSVQRALAFEPEHLSCYELTIEEGTPLGEDVAAGRCVPTGVDAAADGFLHNAALLERAGYEHYEVSSFARGTEHRSEHNGKYWRHVPYLGLGPAAHSFDGERRWSNVRNLDEYARALEAGESAVDQTEALTPEQLRWERVSLGLRTSDGIDMNDLDAAVVDLAALDQLAASGLLQVEDGRIRPTTRGLLVADALTRRLLFGAGH